MGIQQKIIQLWSITINKIHCICRLLMILLLPYLVLIMVNSNYFEIFCPRLKGKKITQKDYCICLSTSYLSYQSINYLYIQTYLHIFVYIYLSIYLSIYPNMFLLNLTYKGSTIYLLCCVRNAIYSPVSGCRWRTWREWFKEIETPVPQLDLRISYREDIYISKQQGSYHFFNN